MSQVNGKTLTLDDFVQLQALLSYEQAERDRHIRDCQSNKEPVFYVQPTTPSQPTRHVQFRRDINPQASLQSGLESARLAEASMKLKWLKDQYRRQRALEVQLYLEHYRRQALIRSVLEEAEEMYYRQCIAAALEKARIQLCLQQFLDTKRSNLEEPKEEMYKVQQEDVHDDEQDLDGYTEYHTQQLENLLEYIFDQQNLEEVGHQNLDVPSEEEQAKNIAQVWKFLSDQQESEYTPRTEYLSSDEEVDEDTDDDMEEQEEYTGDEDMEEDDEELDFIPLLVEQIKLQQQQLQQQQLQQQQLQQLQQQKQQQLLEQQAQQHHQQELRELHQQEKNQIDAILQKRQQIQQLQEQLYQKQNQVQEQEHQQQDNLQLHELKQKQEQEKNYPPVEQMQDDDQEEKKQEQKKQQEQNQSQQEQEQKKIQHEQEEQPAEQVEQEEEEQSDKKIEQEEEQPVEKIEQEEEQPVEMIEQEKKLTEQIKQAPQEEQKVDQKTLETQKEEQARQNHASKAHKKHKKKKNKKNKKKRKSAHQHPPQPESPARKDTDFPPVQDHIVPLQKLIHKLASEPVLIGEQRTQYSDEPKPSGIWAKDTTKNNKPNAKSPPLAPLSTTTGGSGEVGNDVDNGQNKAPFLPQHIFTEAEPTPTMENMPNTPLGTQAEEEDVQQGLEHFVNTVAAEQKNEVVPPDPRKTKTFEELEAVSHVLSDPDSELVKRWKTVLKGGKDGKQKLKFNKENEGTLLLTATTPFNRQFLGSEDELLRTMIRLDAVESFADPSIRAKRKKLVKTCESMLDELDKYKQSQWEKAMMK